MNVFLRKLLKVRWDCLPLKEDWAWIGSLLWHYLWAPLYPPISFKTRTDENSHRTKITCNSVMPKWSHVNWSKGLAFTCKSRWAAKVCHIHMSRLQLSPIYELPPIRHLPIIVPSCKDEDCAAKLGSKRSERGWTSEEPHSCIFHAGKKWHSDAGLCILGQLLHICYHNHVLSTVIFCPQVK